MTRLAPATALLCLLSAPALADITADDLWAAQVDLWARLGMTLKGDLSRDGSIVTVSGQGGELALPMGLGTLLWWSNDLVMTEDGSGAVVIDLSAPQTLTLGLHIAGRPEFDLSAEFTATWTNALAHASGTPDMIELSVVADKVDYTLDGFSLAPGYDAGDPEADLFVTVIEPVSLLEIERGDLTRVVLTQRGTRSITDMALRQDVMSTRGVIDQTELLAEITLMLPETPLDPLDLGPALRAGFEAEVNSRGMALAAQTVAYYMGERVSDDRQTAGPSNMFMRLAADGLTVRGEQTGYSYSTDLSQMGIGTVGFSLDRSSGQFQLPLLAAEGEETALFALDLTGLHVDDVVWRRIGGMMAPESLRQPADVRLALRATGEVLHDLTDVMGLTQKIEAEEAVVALRGVSLDDLRLAYAGAELTGTGSLGWDEPQRLPGDEPPPPVGRGDFVLTGAYALLDQVSQTGLVPPEGLVAARAALAAIGRPTGEDRLESSIVFDETGQATLNGAPLPF